jgi:hypothetical protein
MSSLAHQMPDDLPPVTADSVRAAIEACNAERVRINAQTGARLPLHPLPVSLRDHDHAR